MTIIFLIFSAAYLFYVYCFFIGGGAVLDVPSPAAAFVVVSGFTVPVAVHCPRHVSLPPRLRWSCCWLLLLVPRHRPAGGAWKEACEEIEEEEEDRLPGRMDHCSPPATVAAGATEPPFKYS
jgi:hypothetical protein